MSGAQRQRGAALLAAMLVVTLVASLAVPMSWLSPVLDEVGGIVVGEPQLAQALLNPR